MESELTADKTADGEKAAAFARAAFPDAAVKARAFELATTEDVSNHIQIQTIAGFQRPSQRELTAPYADKYFAMINDYWNSHSYELASNVAALLYPTYQVSQATLVATQSWLAGAGINANHGLRRIISEHRDALVRALNAQRKDA